MKNILLFLCLFGTLLYAEESFDQDLYRQAVRYNPSFSENFYSWRIPIEDFMDFLEIYENRPIQENLRGVASHGAFYLWHLIKKIKPSLIIESGVYRGQSTWILEQAAPDAQLISIDPDLSPRLYISRKATYLTRDFKYLKIPEGNKGPIVCFFDDHQNVYQRILQAHRKGIKYLIFDDNYPAGFDDGGYTHLTLRNCFELTKHERKAARLKQLIKHYYIMPQIIGSSVGYLKTRNWDDLPAIWEGLKELPTQAITNIPCLWNHIEEVPAPYREKMATFSRDSLRYRFLTLVELY